MNKQWLDSYPPGVPAEIDQNAFPSINALLADAQSRFGLLPAFSNMGATLTYDELARQAGNFASYLQYGIGMAKGERIAIMMPNLLQYPVALFGAMAAGCVVVNVNPLYTARELQHQLSNAGATCIVVLENFAHTVQEVLANTPLRRIIVARLGDMLHFPRAQLTEFMVKHVKHLVPPWQIDGAIDFDDVLDAGAQLARCQMRAEPDDITFLQYTGGTTGVPKAAILTHANIVANVLQTSAWVAGTLRDGRETAVVPLPLYHVFALTSMLCFVHIGAHIVLVTNPRDMDSFIKVLAHARMTVLIGVNTLFKALLEAPGLGDDDVAGRARPAIWPSRPTVPNARWPRCGDRSSSMPSAAPSA